jgi:hypothetical protein
MRPSRRLCTSQTCPTPSTRVQRSISTIMDLDQPRQPSTEPGRRCNGIGFPPVRLEPGRDARADDAQHHGPVVHPDRAKRVILSL